VTPEAAPIAPSPKPPHCATCACTGRPTLRGWKEIRRRADLSEKTARRRALPGDRHRLPVYLDQRGRPIARASEIDQWRQDELRPYGVQPYGHISRPLPSPAVNDQKRAKIKRR
jgi:hypothetical protein